jgi:tRNA (cmo5U34)-methyltransferase
MEQVKMHFEAGAATFDQHIVTIIPYYSEMITALVSAIPFESNSSISVMDIGCGTGTVAKQVKDLFPNARITCIDIAENMLMHAQQKLAGCSNVRFLTGDILQYQFDEEYDVVFSSLALHHLSSVEDKKKIYQKIFNAVTENGVFYAADEILASEEYVQQHYMEKWKKFMARTISWEEIENQWIPRYYAEDHPEKLTDHLSWLSEVGFRDVDVIWKYYNFAVYGGLKEYGGSYERLEDDYL